MRDLLTFVGLFICLAGVVSIIRPIRFLRIRSRGIGAAVAVVGFIWMGIAVPKPTPEQRAAAEERRASERAARAATQATTPKSQAVPPATPPDAPKASSYSAASPTCVEVVGQTEKDRDNALVFCANAVPEGLVVGAIAQQSILSLKVPRGVADQMLRDRLTSENVIKRWMAGWKTASGNQVVSISVEYLSAEVATGQTTIMSGDVVTFRK